jgi:hypothetical protein
MLTFRKFQARIPFILLLILLLSACAGGGSDGGDTTGGGGASNYGTATLSWLPPTENTDGSTLTNLAGYNIYYGTEAGNYTEAITIDNPGIAEYVVDNLPPGNTYYFVITAFDSSGNESEYSTMGSKTIPV